MASLSERLQNQYHQFNFFQAVSLIEEYFSLSGVKNAIDSGKIRFVPDPSISFPPNDISSIHEVDGVFEVMPSFMGLLGVTSPLPIYFSEYFLRRPENSLPLYNFLAIFNHRIHTLFYRAWKKYHYIKAISQDANDQLTKNISKLSGNISETISEEHQRLLTYCGILAGSRRGPAALKAMISDYFNHIPVDIKQFFQRWVPIKNISQIGKDSQLGLNSFCGTSYFDVSGKFRVVVGPLKREVYETFLSGTENIETMKKLIKRYIAEPLDFDIEVQLQSVDLIPVIIGSDNARIGTTSSLGQSDAKADVQSVVIEG